MKCRDLPLVSRNRFLFYTGHLALNRMMKKRGNGRKTGRIGRETEEENEEEESLSHFLLLLNSFFFLFFLLFLFFSIFCLSFFLSIFVHLFFSFSSFSPLPSCCYYRYFSYPTFFFLFLPFFHPIYSSSSSLIFFVCRLISLFVSSRQYRLVTISLLQCFTLIWVFSPSITRVGNINCFGAVIVVCCNVAKFIRVYNQHSLNATIILCYRLSRFLTFFVIISFPFYFFFFSSSSAPLFTDY